MEILGINTLNIILWIVFGLLVGVIAGFIDKGRVKGGMLGTIIIGLLGALVGGFLAKIIFGFQITGFNLQSLLIAVLGALLVVLIQRILFRDNSHIKTTTEYLEKERKEES